MNKPIKVELHNAEYYLIPDETGTYNILHREDGPAVIYKEHTSYKTLRSETYYLNGVEHRTDGPSDIIYYKYHDVYPIIEKETFKEHGKYREFPLAAERHYNLDSKYENRLTKNIISRIKNVLYVNITDNLFTIPEFGDAPSIITGCLYKEVFIKNEQKYLNVIYGSGLCMHSPDNINNTKKPNIKQITYDEMSGNINIIEYNRYNIANLRFYPNGNISELIESYYNPDKEYHKDIYYYDNENIKEEHLFFKKKHHALGKPAIILYNRSGEKLKEEYYKNGDRHSLVSPAIINYETGKSVFYINGTKKSDKDFSELRNTVYAEEYAAELKSQSIHIFD